MKTAKYQNFLYLFKLTKSDSSSPPKRYQRLRDTHSKCSGNNAFIYTSTNVLFGIIDTLFVSHFDDGGGEVILQV